MPKDALLRRLTGLCLDLPEAEADDGNRLIAGFW
jgi:hypothetical protein